MRAFFESSFDIIYLIFVTLVGFIMIKQSNENSQYKLFGIMAVVLGFGDAFHLVPRMIALCTTGFDDYIVPLGIGKAITSVTMTIFYILLYHIWIKRYNMQNQKNLTITIYALALARIILCMLPQNKWTSADAPITWNIYRNIPFTIMGIIIIYIFYKSAKDNNDQNFKFMWLTIVLSFAFYIPVVLFADKIPMIGMLMIPKTCAYVWTVLIGYYSMRKEQTISYKEV